MLLKKFHTVKTGTVLGFMATDNIASFFKALDSVKFKQIYWFGVVDLWEMKNIRLVVGCLHALARYVGTLPGNFVKIKDLSKVKQEFNEREINETKKILEELDQKEDPNKKMKIDLFPTIEETVELDQGDINEEIEIQEELKDEKTEIVDDLANPEECTVEGKGSKNGYAGVESKFIIIARDTVGIELEKGGEEFTVVLFHKTQKDIKINGTVKDLGTGKYEVTYTPKIAGDYNMEIYLIDDISGFSDDEVEKKEDGEKKEEITIKEDGEGEIKIEGEKKRWNSSRTYDH